jgi:hypothetical protein
MKKMFIGLAVGTIAMGSLGLATSATAYNQEAFGYSASHFLKPSQLPAEFKAKKGIQVSITEPSFKPFVCSTQGENGTEIDMATPLRTASGNYNIRNKNLELFINVSEFKTNVAAEKAFEKLSKDIKKCEGSTTGSWTDEDGTVYPYENSVTTGKIPAVTVVGVQSVFVNQNSNNAAAGGQPAYLSDSFNIYTLVNNVVISSQSSTGSALNLTAKQKKAMTQIANAMVTAWVD